MYKSIRFPQFIDFDVRLGPSLRFGIDLGLLGT